MVAANDSIRETASPRQTVALSTHESPLTGAIQRSERPRHSPDPSIFPRIERVWTLAAAPATIIEPSMLTKEYASVTRAHSSLSRSTRLALAAAVLMPLAACGGGDRPTTELQAAQVNAIGVNAFLWRASLETVSFAPLLQADSAGGVIVTDWYANPANPEERVKLTITILDQDLRADALRVAAIRQVAQAGNWVDAPVQAATVQKLEDIILTKARDLRRKAVAG